LCLFYEMKKREKETKGMWEEEEKEVEG